MFFLAAFLRQYCNGGVTAGQIGNQAFIDVSGFTRFEQRDDMRLFLRDIKIQKLLFIGIGLRVDTLLIIEVLGVPDHDRVHARLPEFSLHSANLDATAPPIPGRSIVQHSRPHRRAPGHLLLIAPVLPVEESDLDAGQKLVRTGQYRE
jgi:hypothetical protein